MIVAGFWEPACGQRGLQPARCEEEPDAPAATLSLPGTSGPYLLAVTLLGVAICAVSLASRPVHAVVDPTPIFVDDSVNDGLAAHWKFDEPGSSTAREVAGGAHARW